MFSIMMERGRRAEEFRAMGVDAVFRRLGHGRYAEDDAEMMRGWLGHMAQSDPSMDLSQRLARIDARHAGGRRRRQLGLRVGHAVRVGLPLLILAAAAGAALALIPDVRAAV